MRFMALLLLLATFAGINTSVTAQNDYACPPGFEGYLPPRLSVGSGARVISGVELNIRSQPTTRQARIGMIPAGRTFIVLEGPRCSEQYIWWRGEYDGVTGWMAEGGIVFDEYWLESRGQVVVIEGDDGIERRYVRGEEGNLEHEGCLRPVDDYSRVTLGYAEFNVRTLAMLDQAQYIYESNGGDVVNFRMSITQGSYNQGGVAASFGTHDGGGAVDLSVRSSEDWSVLTDEIEPMIEALRIAGFAAWLRDSGELYSDSPIHIHAIAVGDIDLSVAARRQIDGNEGYLRGFNGLPAEDYGGPIADGHGGPIVCNWMIEDGFGDLREENPG
jgi:hypothetical protein